MKIYQTCCLYARKSTDSFICPLVVHSTANHFSPCSSLSEIFEDVMEGTIVERGELAKQSSKLFNMRDGRLFLFKVPGHRHIPTCYSWCAICNVNR